MFNSFYFAISLGQWVWLKYFFKEKWHNKIYHHHFIVSLFLPTNIYWALTEHSTDCYVQKHLTCICCFWGNPKDNLITEQWAQSTKLVKYRSENEINVAGDDISHIFVEKVSLGLGLEGREIWARYGLGILPLCACAIISTCHFPFWHCGFVCFWIQCSSQ